MRNPPASTFSWTATADPWKEGQLMPFCFTKVILELNEHKAYSNPALLSFKC